MRRLLAIVAVALVLGAIVTVLLSWYFAYYYSNIMGKPFQAYEEPIASGWMCRVPDEWLESPNPERLRIVYLGYEFTFQYATVDTEKNRRIYALNRSSSGWPMLSLSYFDADIKTRSNEFDPTVPETPGHESAQLPFKQLTNGVRIKVPFSSNRIARLPLIPRPLGFAVNTLLYGFIWLSFIVGCSAVLHRVRGASRTRQGKCRKCGYDLASLPTCPECNTPAPPRTIAP